MTVTYGEFRAYQSENKLWYADEDLRDVYIFCGERFVLQAVVEKMNKAQLKAFLQDAVDNTLGENNGDR